MNMQTRASLCGAFTVLASLSGGCSWFGGGVCKDGQQSCRGKQIVTCMVDTMTGETKWQPLGTCSLAGPTLTCQAVDGIAECVLESSLDAGVGAPGAPDGAAVGSRAFASPGDSLKVPTAELEWLRLEVHRAPNGQYRIDDVKSSYMSVTMASPMTGEVAAVAYGEQGQKLDATIVPVFNEAPVSSVWLRAAGVTRVALVDAGEHVLAEVMRAPASAPKAGVIMHALEGELPPTLNIMKAEDQLPGRSEGEIVPLVATAPTPEMLALLGGALKRPTPLGASVLTNVAFTTEMGRLSAYMDAASAQEEAAAGEWIPDAGAAIAAAADAGGPRGRTSVDPFRDEAVSGADAGAGGESSATSTLPTLLVGGVLVINVSEPMMARYRADPPTMHLHVLRQLGRLFMRLSSQSKDGAPFPDDFPPEIAALLKQRVLPFLGLRESFAGAWASLHNAFVEPGLAKPYSETVVYSDADALAAGFAAAPGARDGESDFAEYVARLLVREQWRPAPCEVLRSGPLESRRPRDFVHLAKIEVVWGLGILSREEMLTCTGEFELAAETQGIVAFNARGEPLKFTRDVLGSHSPYYHGEVHVSLAATLPQPGPDGGLPAAEPDPAIVGDPEALKGMQAVLDVGFRGAPGLFRLSPVSKRKDPEIGAGLYITDPRTYEKRVAAGGLLLVTRVDETRIEAHALSVVMQRPDSIVPEFWPLVTARYDVPPEDRESSGPP
jgi:hypothetical protein